MSHSKPKNRIDLGEKRKIEELDEPTVEKKHKPSLNYYTGRELSSHYYELLEARRKLPAYEARDALIDLLREHQTVILIGETGSGKTTQIPQFLL